MVDEPIQVLTQGITEDLTRADGSFEAIERGSMTPLELMNFLERVKGLKTPEFQEAVDFCQPHVLAEGAGGQQSFLMEGGRSGIRTWSGT